MQHPPPVVVVPCSDRPEGISELFQQGASDYLLPPFRRSEVEPRLRRLLAHYQTEALPLNSLKESLGLQQIVGESPALLEQVHKIPKLARCDACVLITGETGTGKEVCARAVHYLSPRSKHPFVPMNCGAVPTDLLENELFGHVAGAYTGANTARAGLIQEAHGGTLFLDEVDSMPPSTQVKILRFLQEREFRQLGSTKTSRADVRIIAACNGDLNAAMESGALRTDLFYRLNVLRLRLPPLRERPSDVPLLARHFLNRFRAEFGSSVRDFVPAALAKLSIYPWPGNVRELQNVIERAFVLCCGDRIQAQDIDLPVPPQEEHEPESFAEQKARLINDFERRYLNEMLARYHGNIGQAARAAHKNRRVFFELMRKHHIRVERGNARDGDLMVNFSIVVDKKVHPDPPRNSG